MDLEALIPNSKKHCYIENTKIFKLRKTRKNKLYKIKKTTVLSFYMYGEHKVKTFVPKIYLQKEYKIKVSILKNKIKQLFQNIYRISHFN